MGKIRTTHWRRPKLFSLFTSRLRVASVFLVFWVLYQHRLYSIYQSALSAKYAPTEFRDIDIAQLDDLGSKLQASLLASRSEWKKLGSGCEGTTFTFNGTVIKTFTTTRSPFRNCAPSNTSLRWPTEIPASLIFGNGPVNSTAVSSPPRNNPRIGFLPVQAAFYAKTGPESIPEWYFVTPLARQGTIENLAKKTRALDQGFRTLDARYRRNFHGLLHSLRILHQAGYCHDDVKPDNVFIGEESEWILGDLGNVRHVSHPYHESRIWSDNKQLRDCRANDAIRALKSYMTFLRKSSRDASNMDGDLFLRSEPLGRLFWWVMDDAQMMTVDELESRSVAEDAAPTSEIEEERQAASASASSHLAPRLSFRTLSRSREIDQLLRLSNSETYARWKALTWIFGIKQDLCPMYS